MFILLASLVLGACSSDNDGPFTVITPDEVPVWHVDWNNDQTRPNWTEPDASLYENWTILKVQIEDELKPYVSEGDLMALFVNGELRGLASPAVNASDGQTAGGKFLMKAYGNETGDETVTMTLQYYNQQLKHIFTLSADIALNSDETTGIDEDFIPEFTYGSAKYPEMMTVIPETILTRFNIKPTSGSMVAAFVGEECRGTATISATGSTSLLIRCRAQGELITLKYYDNTEKKLYTIRDIANL